jgi:general secretion pathway protein G
MFGNIKRRNAALRKRGDWMSSLNSTGRRFLLPRRPLERGFTLIELVITITVLTIMTLGVMPLVKVAVRRQQEQQLRDALRQIRSAIDEFHRDTVGMVCTGTGIGPPTSGGAGPVNTVIDPRSKVVISDCTVFGVDNPDHYPPSLEILYEGVNVIPRGGRGIGGQGLESTGTKPTDTTSQLGSELATKKKVYLRQIPIDPLTGKAEWDLKSCYDAMDSTSWGGENVFDVRSKSRAKALNGEQYSDW